MSIPVLMAISSDTLHPLSVVSLRISSPAKSPHTPYSLINDSKSCRLLHLTTSPKAMQLGTEGANSPILIQSLAPSPKIEPGRGREGRGRRRGSPVGEWRGCPQKMQLTSVLSTLRVTKASTFLSPIHIKRPRSRPLPRPPHPLFSLLLVSASPASKPAYPGQLTGWDT